LATASGAKGGSPRDGRTLRAARSRRAIVDALLALIGEGTPVPTAREVAERAGVGMRTVFRHFSDMESLYAEMSERMRTEIRPLLEGDPPEGPLEVRLRDLVERRALLFERILPFRRSSEAQRARSPFLEAQIRRDARALRAGLHRWLPELSPAGDGARPEVTEALDAVLSPELWVRLRTVQRLGPRRSRETLEHLARALVQEASP